MSTCCGYALKNERIEFCSGPAPRCSAVTCGTSSTGGIAVADAYQSFPGRAVALHVS